MSNETCVGSSYALSVTPEYLSGIRVHTMKNLVIQDFVMLKVMSISRILYATTKAALKTVTEWLNVDNMTLKVLIETSIAIIIAQTLTFGWISLEMKQWKEWTILDIKVPFQTNV